MNHNLFKMIALSILGLLQIGYSLAQTGLSRATAFE